MASLRQRKILPKTQVVTSAGTSYQITKELGKGYFGKVYLAKDLKSGDQVALKMQSEEHSPYNPVMKAYAAGLDYFVGNNKGREIAALRKVGDLHAEPFKFKGQEVTPLKFHPGITLDRFFRENPNMDVSTFQTLRQKVFATIGELHQKHGLAHGDLHHQNIMIDTKSKPKLIDLGVAGEIQGAHSLTRKGYSTYNDFLVPETYFLAYAKKHYSKTHPLLVRELQANLKKLYEQHANAIPQKSIRVALQNEYYTGLVAKEYLLSAQILHDLIRKEPLKLKQE